MFLTIVLNVMYYQECFADTCICVFKMHKVIYFAELTLSTLLVEAST